MFVKKFRDCGCGAPIEPASSSAVALSIADVSIGNLGDNKMLTYR
jgi:hypothetical protein